MRRHSITLRLTGLFAVAAALVMLPVGVLISQMADQHFEEMDTTELRGKLALVLNSVSRVRMASDLDGIEPYLADALVGHTHLAIAVVSGARDMRFGLPDAGFPAALIDRAAGATTLAAWTHEGRRYRGLVALASTAQPLADPVRVAVAIDTEQHHVFMGAFRRSLALALLLGMSLTVPLGWFAARRGLLPVRRMAGVTQGISVAQLGERLPLDDVPSELFDLARALNGMLERLEDSFKRLSEFSSDLAHELRTPISNLMMQTQVALSKARSDDEYREVLYSNLEEFERLARMIADMLFLAKADHGLLTPSREPVDLAEQVNALFTFYEAYADSRGVALRSQGAAVVQGDALMIRRALSNLLSNAIRHTEPAGAVAVHLATLPGAEIEVVVENPGADIPADHLARLFDRFHRVDPSRQQGSEGVGLGLAITQSVIEAHGARVSVTSNAGVTRFSLRFPAQAAAQAP